MALSGTITGKADNTSYTLTCEWSATQSVTNNTSTITASVYLKAPSGWSTVSSYWNCSINGTQVTTNKSATVSSTKVLLGTRTWTVTHANDGSCSTTISFSYSNGLTSAGTYTTKTGSGSATITLNTIPRASTFTLSSSSLNMDKSQTVTISRASSSFTHTVAYTFGSSTTTVATKTTSTSVSFTPPVSLASQIPNATSGTCTVKVTTYNGSTAIATVNKTFTLVVPSTVKPSVLITPTYNNTLGGLSIAGKTTVTVKPTGTGAHGSTIKSYSYSGAGLSGTGSSKTTGTLTSGTYTITVTATDSRGRTGNGTVNLTVYPYSAPTLSASVYRCDSAGNKEATGSYAAVKLTYTISNPNNANTNARQYKIETKKPTESTFNVLTNWTDLPDGYTSTTNSVLLLGDGWATTSSYDIKVSIKDNYNTVSVTPRLSTISAVLNIESGGIGVGKLRERGVLDIQGSSYITGEHCFSSDLNGKARIGYYTKDACTFIANGNNNWLRLNDDKTLTYAGYTVYHSGNMSALITTEDNDKVEVRASAISVAITEENTVATSDFNRSAMDVINDSSVYKQDKQIGITEVPEEVIRTHQRKCVETDSTKILNLTVEEKSIDLYAMISLAWKALQEKDQEIKELRALIEAK